MRPAPAVRIGANRAPGCAAEPLDRSGDRDGGERARPPVTRTGRRHRGDAGLALADRLRPAAPAHLGQRAGGEPAAGEQSIDDAGLGRHAHSTCAPEPAVSGSRVPTGTVVRSPVAARPRRRRRGRRRRAGRAARSRRTRRAPRPAPGRRRSTSGSGSAAASSPTRGPSTKRPSASRASSRCTSSATASRCAVARGSAGGLDQLGERARRRGDRAEDRRRSCRRRRYRCWLDPRC